MKKVVIVIMTMLLVLVVGQVVMAKVDATVGLTLGYNAREYNYERKNDPSEFGAHTFSGFAIGMFGNIYVMDKLSFEIDASVAIGSWEDYRSWSATKKSNLSLLNIQAFVRYDVLFEDRYKLGVQVGTIYDYMNTEKTFGTDKIDAFFIAPGIYGEFDVLPKLKIFADVRLPVYASFNFTHNGEGSYFLKLFLYDAKIGVMYEVAPQVNIGIEGNLYNVNSWRLYWLFAVAGNNSFIYTSKSAFNIGLKAEYKF